MELINSGGWPNGAKVPGKVFITEEITAEGVRGYEYSEAPPQLRYYDAIFGGYSGQNFITMFYALPEIFAPVHEIASRVADITFQLKGLKDDKVDYNNKQFNRLFTQANPLQSFKQFIYQAVCYKILTGGSFIYLNRPRTTAATFDNINTWLNLPTHALEVKMKPGIDVYSATKIEEIIDKYTTPTENGRQREFEVKNVISLLNYDLADGTRPDRLRSPLIAAAPAIRNLMPVYEARNVIYTKRGALGFFVSKKSDESGYVSLTPKEIEQAHKDYQGSYGLVGRKNQIGITSVPLEYIKTAMSIAELQPFDETLADAIAIYKVLRVPEHLAPTKDKSTFANGENDMKSFYADVILPEAASFAELFTNALQIPARYIAPDSSGVQVLQENRKERTDAEKTQGDTWLQRWKSGACSLNEWIAAFDGTTGTGAIYEKKLFELTPEERDQVMKAINTKQTAAAPQQNNTENETEDTSEIGGTENQGGAD